MAVLLVGGLVEIPIEQHRPVVAGEDDESVVSDLESIKCGHDLAHRPVDFHYGIAADATAALAAKPWMRSTGHVRIVRAEVEKKRLVAICLDEPHRTFCERVGDVFVGPQRGLASGHVANPADAIEDDIGVLFVGAHLQQLWVVPSGGLAADRAVVAHLDRVGGVELGDVVTINEHAGHAVNRGGNEECGVETDFQRAGFDFTVEIHRCFAVA